MLIDRLSILAAAIQADWHGDPDATCTTLCTDTRRIEPGALFVALRGERFDGHAYVAEALAGGASAVVVDQDMSADYPDAAARQLIVPDTRLALGLIGGAIRRRWSGTLIAVTGNSGKTTVKEMVREIANVAAPHQVLATAGNFNNDIGAPLTLAQLEAQHRYAVIELGANHIGEIAWIGSLAAPQVALINNVTGAHVGEFGSMGHIAQAKGELISTLDCQTGRMVLNRDDRFYPLWAAAAEQQLALPVETFGMERLEGWHVRALSATAEGYRFTLHQDDTALGQVTLNMLGRHNVHNAVAAASAASAAGIAAADIITGLNRCSAFEHRLRLKAGRHDIRVLDDSYNANPGAMKAAIDALMSQPGPHWFVMGAMGELGRDAPTLHADIGHYAKAQGVDQLLTFGEMARCAADAFGGQHFNDWDALEDNALTRIPAGACVLVKGSHSMNMNRLVTRLCEPVSGDTHLTRQ